MSKYFNDEVSSDEANMGMYLSTPIEAYSSIMALFGRLGGVTLIEIGPRFGPLSYRLFAISRFSKTLLVVSTSNANPYHPFPCVTVLLSAAGLVPPIIIGGPPA